LTLVGGGPPPPLPLQVELFLQFFVGVYTKDLQYVDSLRAIAAKHLRAPGKITFDMATSIPWSCIDFNEYVQSCIINPESAVSLGSPSNSERIVRIVKIFRILRIVKVLRLARFVM
jgi:hypothetical protein